MKRELNLLFAAATALGLFVWGAEHRSRLRAAPAPPRPGAARTRPVPLPDRRDQPLGETLPDDGRGRTADRPTKIPPRGWWDIARRVAVQVSEDRVMTEAAAVTFYTLLAVFPGLAALVSIYGLFADPKAIADHLNVVANFLPGGGVDILRQQIQALTAKGGGALGVGAIFGLLASLWSANQGSKALFDALNVVYEEREKRGYLLRTAISLAFTLGGLLFLLLALGAIVVVPVVLGYVGLGSSADRLIDLLRWPVLLVAVSAMLSAAYRFGPSRTQPRWRWVSWGGAFAALAWLLVSAAFSWYVGHFGSYNKTYGSLGAAVGFMTWIWLSSTVILIGAELNAEMEHQTERDTTVGPEKPLGRRGADKANRVAGYD